MTDSEALHREQLERASSRLEEIAAQLGSEETDEGTAVELAREAAEIAAEVGNVAAEAARAAASEGGD
jgi:hypothetical protein